MKPTDEIIDITIDRIIDRTWDLLDVAVVQAQEQDPCVLCNKDTKGKYSEALREKYKFMMQFMKPSVSSLDRHKVASIIIASVIETDAVVYNKDVPKNNSFFGKYMIAVSVGLSYMLELLNIRLSKKEIEVKQYLFPEAFSCTTPYFEIFSRNLFLTHERTNWKLNLLDMSELLFFIEYMTLKENGIDPSILTDERVAEEETN